MIRELFLLLKPRMYAFKNRWRGTRRGRAVFQDLIAVTLLAILLGSIFQGSYEALQYLDRFRSLAYLSASHLFSVVALGLFVMSFLSNAVLALGSLYLSHDLDLLLSSPVHFLQLFVGRLVQTFVLSSWMPFLFLFPMLVGFGLYEQAPWYYYIILPLFVGLFLLIPTALSFIVVTSALLVLPKKRGRKGRYVFFILLGVTGYLIAGLIKVEVRHLTSAEQFLRLIQIVSLPNAHWLPSYWLSEILERLLYQREIALHEVVLLLSTTLWLLSLAYLFLDRYYRRALQRLESFRSEVVLSGRSRFLEFIPSSILPTAQRAFLEKDIRLLVRDFAQLIQLVILCALSWVYLYNLRIFKGLETVPVSVRFGWEHFVAITNITIGAFLITAIGLRFVYPSLSLEGRAYWNLLSSPLGIPRLLKMKFWFWYPPVCFIACCFFALGSVAMGAPFKILLSSVFAAAIITYGIVGIALGCGAYFANFEWEHPTELIGSFGGLIFILLSISFISLCCLPSTLFVYLQVRSLQPDQFANWSNGELSLVSVVILVSLCVLTTRVGVRIGEKELLRRMS